jgi:hypothetical protein
MGHIGRDIDELASRCGAVVFELIPPPYARCSTYNVDGGFVSFVLMAASHLTRRQCEQLKMDGLARHRLKRDALCV